MSLLDNILAEEPGYSPRCPVKLYCLENVDNGEELLEAIDANTEGQYVLPATVISKYLTSVGTKISAVSIRNHRRHDCACAV